MLRSLLILACLAGPAIADPARILSAEARATPTGWRVDVTLAHGDTGWEDYADGWRIEDAAGAVLATRVLHHPHVEEQPFTRALFDVDLPEGLDEIFIRARTNVTGWGADRLALHLPR